MKDHYRKVHEHIERVVADRVYEAEENDQEVAFSEEAGISVVDGKFVQNGTFLLTIRIGPFHTVPMSDAAAVAPSPSSPGVGEASRSMEDVYGVQLDQCADILQKHHPIGQVKAIGRMEVVRALREVLAPSSPGVGECKHKFFGQFNSVPVCVYCGVGDTFPAPSSLGELVVNGKYKLAIDCTVEGLIDDGRVAVHIADEGLELGGVIICVDAHQLSNYSGTKEQS